MTARRVAALLCALTMLAACTTPTRQQPAPPGTPPPAAAHPVTPRPQAAPTPSAPKSPKSKPKQHPTVEGPAPVALSLKNARQSPGVVAAGPQDATYNYGPTVMLEGGKYRMWWCSQMGIAQPPGDDILYASSSTMDGPFGDGVRTPKPVLSGNWKGFDSRHVCDPSVIKVHGVYVMYYTGATGDDNTGNAIGMATSKDGIVWRRESAPVVTPAGDVQRPNAYGAGQPSAVYRGGWVYLMFTDTTGAAAGSNGAGQFLLRSRDPAFRSGVQALGVGGFQAVSDTAAPRTSSLADAFSSDLMWIDALGVFVLAHQTTPGTTLTFWDPSFTRNPYPPVTMTGPWQEGPGLVRTASGDAPVRPHDPCGTVRVDLIRATSNPRAPTGLQHFGADLVGGRGC